MNFENRVDQTKIKKEIKDKYSEIEHAFRTYATSWGPTVTYGTEGIHSPGSLHYKGFAIDIRTYNLPGGCQGSVVKKIVQELKIKLGYNYDVILETDHIHIEYDPKK